VSDIPIKDPVFIIGNPRIGSTLLHNLLSVDPLTRTPMLWEMRHPTSDPKEERIATSTKYVNGVIKKSPQFDVMHPMDPLDVEECTQVKIFIISVLQL
jgi:hypothetical protein